MKGHLPLGKAFGKLLVPGNLHAEDTYSVIFKAS
jgi:hypothetical protein